MSNEPLPSWTDTRTRRAIVEFVERVTIEGGPEYVPPAERIAVYDNDGMLRTGICAAVPRVSACLLLRRLAGRPGVHGEASHGRQRSCWRQTFGGRSILVGRRLLSFVSAPTRSSGRA